MTKIVLLNDELGSQMQIYLALCDSYKIEIAENIQSAMYLLRKAKPHILLMDYDFNQFRTNGKTGIDFIKKVKKKYSKLKVMTILEDEHKSLEGTIQQNGADGVLYKPIKNKQLVSDLQKLAAPVAAS
ncbi:response regulator transcription factor [candidate division KSB1 bacterium]|nr:response regulator transcription factor [candidate division KSB1 bacterium]NIT70247.1 response regulator transcription factor [candidate division KSB1 bacterium]NIX69928.1 response regulator [candidate division KSB1 bacterium]